MRRASLALAFNVLVGVLLTLLIGAACWGADESDPDADPDMPKVAPSHGLRLRGGVTSFGVLSDEAQFRFGVFCKKDGAQTVVDQVRPNSEAAKQGLRKGDIVLNATKSLGVFQIDIRRDGTVYRAKLGELTPRVAPDLRSGISAADFVLNKTHADLKAEIPTSVFNLSDARERFKLTATDVNILAKYNIEFILDRSNSMKRRDCPGGLSRWDWCGTQAIDIAQALAPYVPNGMTITRFAGDYDVHERCSPGDFVNILSQHDFQQGTRLAEPLADRLQACMQRYRQGQKPLLIVVITDGVPWPRPEQGWVVDVLVDAARKMVDPKEVTVVFLQVGGDDPRGEAYVQELSENLPFYGAPRQIVHCKTFGEIQSVGLARALVDTMSTYGKQ